MLNGIQIIGSIAGTQVDMAEVFQLHARGRTHVTYQRRPLESVNQSFADILAGRIPARIGSTLGRRRPPSEPDPDVGALWGRWSMLDPTAERLGPHTWVAEPWPPGRAWPG